MKINKKICLYADGANLSSILSLNKLKYIKGFTTNPTLMRQSGIKNYKIFAKKILKKIKNKPISFEVFADDISKMEIQANEIASWGKNVNVKIPITNTKGKSTNRLIAKLAKKKIICNVTAIFTVKQVSSLLKKLKKKDPLILSIFAGRIADTGVDPEPIIRQCKKLIKEYKNIQILWASTREVFNIFQAERSGCDIITVPHDILGKIKYINKNLVSFSKETVNMFYKDALKVGYKI
jgi:transaldolase